MSETHIEVVKTELSGTDECESPPPAVTSTRLEELQHRFSKGLQEKWTYTNSVYQEYPLTTTFTAILATLSAVPIITFCGTSIFVLSSFLLVSISFALCTSFAIISFFGLALLALLGLAAATAIFLTATVVGGYLSTRLLFLIYSEVKTGENEGIIAAFICGLKAWTDEIRAAFLRELRLVSNGKVSHEAGVEGKLVFTEEHN